MTKILMALGIIVLASFLSFPAFAGSKCKDFEPALCFQIHSPAWCVSLSVGGEVVSKPLLAKGVNRCFATNSLKKRACDKGLNWRELIDEEVHCVPIN